MKYKSKTATKTVGALVTRNGGGNTPTVVTPEGIIVARELARLGHPLYGIAAALGTTADGLKGARERQPELQAAIDGGHAKLEAELVHNLLRASRDGQIAASMFLLKTRCGYREQGPVDGGPDNRVQVNIQVPPPLSDAEFQKIIDGQASAIPDGPQSPPKSIGGAVR